jgi:secreted trypsin-like serine protease
MRCATRLLAALTAVAAVLAPTTARAVAPQVVGGEPVVPGRFPFAASLTVAIPSGGVAACSGSLVAPSYVLTAAHCVTDAEGGVVDPRAIEVGIGDEPLSRSGPPSAAIQVTRHPLWDQTTIDDDWALVRLAHPSAATPVALAAAGDPLAAGTAATIVGWGKTTDTSGLPDTLQTAVLPVRDTATCLAAYPLFDTATQLCAGIAGPGGRDGCNGDSGGPLLVSSGGTWQEVGVVSYGLGSGCTAAPTAFARVSAARPFIDAVVAGTYGAPRVHDVEVAAGETTATFTATVASGGMPTHVRLGAGSAAGHYHAQAQALTVAAGTGTTRVTLHLGHLRPATTYHVVVDVWSAAGGTRSGDVAVTPADRTAPRLAVTRSLVVRRGRRLRLRYTVADASRRVSLAASVSHKGRVVRRFTLPAFSLDGVAPPVAWRVPPRARPGTYLVCLAARDAAGNRSATACAIVHVRR